MSMLAPQTGEYRRSAMQAAHIPAANSRQDISTRRIGARRRQTITSISG